MPPVLQPAAAEILRFVRHVPRHKPPRVHQHPVDSMPNPSHLGAHHYLDFFLLVSLGRCSFLWKVSREIISRSLWAGNLIGVGFGGFPGKAMQWAEIGKPHGARGWNLHFGCFCVKGKEEPRPEMRQKEPDKHEDTLPETKSQSVVWPWKSMVGNC